MKNLKPVSLVFASLLALAAGSEAKEQKAAHDHGAAAERIDVGSKGMACCKPAGDSLKAVRKAVQEALKSEDKATLKSALQLAEAQLGKMEAHKEMCEAKMKSKHGPDSLKAEEACNHGAHHGAHKGK